MVTIWTPCSDVCLLSLSLCPPLSDETSFYAAVPPEGRCLLPPTGVLNSFKGGNCVCRAEGEIQVSQKVLGQLGLGAEGAKQILPLMMQTQEDFDRKAERQKAFVQTATDVWNGNVYISTPTDIK